MHILLVLNRLQSRWQKGRRQSGFIRPESKIHSRSDLILNVRTFYCSLATCYDNYNFVFLWCPERIFAKVFLILSICFLVENVMFSIYKPAYHRPNLIPRILFSFYRKSKNKWSSWLSKPKSVSFHSLKHPRLKSTPSGQGKQVVTTGRSQTPRYITLSAYPKQYPSVWSTWNKQFCSHNEVGKESELHLRKSTAVAPEPFWNLRSDYLFPWELL